MKPNFKVKVEGNSIGGYPALRKKKPDRALHGLYRALIANMVEGVEQRIQAVKWNLPSVWVIRRSAQSNVLELSLGIFTQRIHGRSVGNFESSGDQGERSNL